MGDDEPFKPKSEHRSVFLIYKGTMTDKKLIKIVDDGTTIIKAPSDMKVYKSTYDLDGSKEYLGTFKELIENKKLNQKQDSD
ncbi:MAG: hypothetical protein QQN63_09585 [Nitrosopumilus sp.]